MWKVTLPSNRPLSNEVQQQVTSIFVTGKGSPGLNDGRTQSVEDLDAYAFSPTTNQGQSDGEVAGLPMKKEHSDCSRLAQLALVLGSSSHVQPDPIESAQPANTALQSDPSQKTDKPKPPCVALRASAIKQQGFSEAVTSRIEAP